MDMMESRLMFEQDQWLVPRPKLGGKSSIEHLFSRFAAMYGQKWSMSPEQTEASMAEWASVLSEEKITLDEVKDGIVACRTKHPSWPPTSLEFLQACRPPADYEAAWRAACAGKQARQRDEMGCWPTIAHYHAYARLMSSPHAQVFDQVKMPRIWVDVLTRAIADMRAGLLEPIPVPHTKIEYKPADKTAAAAALKAIGATGIGSKATAARIGVITSWWIALNKPKQTPTVLKIAKDALESLGATPEELAEAQAEVNRMIACHAGGNYA